MTPRLRNAAKFRSYFFNEYVDQEVRDANNNPMMQRNYHLDNFSIDPYYMEDKAEELVMMNQTTYLVKSYTVDEFKALSGEVMLDDLNLSADWLMTQEALKETPGSMHRTTAKDLYAFNKRLMLGRASQELSHGYAFLPSSKWGGAGLAATIVSSIISEAPTGSVSSVPGMCPETKRFLRGRAQTLSLVQAQTGWKASAHGYRIRIQDAILLISSRPSAGRRQRCHSP